MDRAEITPTTKELAPQGPKRRSLKEILPMGICCAAPLLLIAAISLFGISLGGFTGVLFPLLVILACPLGMYFMMRTTHKK